MFNVKFKASADKRFSKLPLDIQKRLVKKLEFLISQTDPLDYAETLTDSRIGKYRFRVGDYRIVFDVEGNIIFILDVGHRKEIYR